jgi:hypothetical protein
MIKILTLIIAGVLASAFLTSCTGKSEDSAEIAE